MKLFINWLQWTERSGLNSLFLACFWRVSSSLHYLILRVFTPWHLIVFRDSAQFFSLSFLVSLHNFYFDVLLIVHLCILISVLNEIDAHNICFTKSLFHAPSSVHIGRYYLFNLLAPELFF